MKKENMKLYNITDIDGFLGAVDHCKGSVELLTSEGDVLNLKSKLCQYVSMANIFNNESYIKELELRISEPEDFERLTEFVMYGD